MLCIEADTEVRSNNVPRNSGGAKGAVAEGVGRPGRHLYRGNNFARRCISTIPIGAPIYIWRLAAISPLLRHCYEGAIFVFLSL